MDSTIRRSKASGIKKREHAALTDHAPPAPKRLKVGTSNANRRVWIIKLHVQLLPSVEAPSYVFLQGKIAEAWKNIPGGVPLGTLEIEKGSQEVCFILNIFKDGFTIVLGFAPSQRARISRGTKRLHSGVAPRF